MPYVDAPLLADPHPELGGWPRHGLRRVDAGAGSGAASGSASVPVVEVEPDGSPVFLDDLDADGLLALAAEAEAQVWAAERRKLRYAYRWCVLHPPTDPGDPDRAATWGECDLALGADGTP